MPGYAAGKMKLIVTSQDRKLVESLQSSALYRGYQEAFRTATGMSMFLRLAHTEQVPRARERDQQNAFCNALSTGCSSGCEECRKAHDHLRASHGPGEHACSGFCFARMMETAVPVRCGGSTIAWLWTGQVFVENSGTRSWDGIAGTLEATGIAKEELERLKTLWEATPEITGEKYRSVVVLLEAFGRQLGELANRLIIESRPQEPAAVTRARRYIRDNLSERLTLEDVARHAGLSPHHFCKVFRRAAGINLIDYINRSRIESARQLLLRDDARVSEIAFEVGYQSLSQFNRTFRSVTGESPSGYRKRLLKPSASRQSA
jgi:AraC-like DNA-binding protein/ligand-binding sensor protein